MSLTNEGSTVSLLAVNYMSEYLPLRLSHKVRLLILKVGSVDWEIGR